MERTKLYIVVAFKGGAKHGEPRVTTYDWLAEEYYADFCEELGLDKANPHSDEADVWQWELDVKDNFSEVELDALGTAAKSEEELRQSLRDAGL